MQAFLPFLALSGSDFAPDFDSVRGVFCAIAWLATALAVLMTIISLFAEVGGGDVDVHTGDSDTSGGDTGIFSLRAIIGFFLGFGWAGFAAAQVGCGPLTALAVSVAAGLAMFGLVAAIIRAIYGLKSEVALDYNSLIGKTGTVYVTLPPKGEPGGQVQIAAGQLLTMPAIQLGETALPAQTAIRVTAAAASHLTVGKI